MKTTRNLILAFAALAALLSYQPAAQANSLVLCAPEVSGASAGPRRVTNPGTSGGSYTLDGSGCAVISTSNADAAYFISQGFSQSGTVRAIIFTTGVATSTTDFVIGTLPPQTYVHNIIVSNAVAAAVTGGISFGTTANGTDIVTALAVGSSGLVFVADSALTKRLYAAATPVHAAAVTAWNSTNVTITVLYSYY